MSQIKNPGITAIVLTLNEEKNIKHCLAQLAWADRIVVVDSGSIDKTMEYVKKFDCSIYSNPWLGFAVQRNWALDNTGITTEWVIFIDADEEVTPDLRSEVCETLTSTSYNAFYLCYKVMLFGKWVKRSSNFPVWHPRIVRLGKARFMEAVTGHGETWDVDGEVGYIQEPYIHYSFSKGLYFWFEKHNRLSAMECTAHLSGKNSLTTILSSLFTRDKHKRRQALRGLSYRLPLRYVFRFLHQLFVKGGIFDGVAGWTYCLLYLAFEIMISSKIREQKYLSRSLND